jgi:hypothetical protein
MRNHLTLGGLHRVLKAQAGRGLRLLANIDGEKAVFLSGLASEDSDENFLFRAVAARDCRARVDDFVAAFDDILSGAPGLRELRVWVEDEGVAYPVAADHVVVGVDKGLVVLALTRESGVRP